MLVKKFPINPSHPERLCWGCDRYCPTQSLACGNGADRTPHPAELFGEHWNDEAPVAVEEKLLKVTHKVER